MKHERVTEDVRELAALYALGSLTQHEARSFEMHIKEGCTACEQELRRFERTVAGIGFAAEEISASEPVRDRLMAQIKKEPQTDASPAVPVREGKPEPPKREPQQPRRTPPELFRSQQKESSRSLGLYVAAFVLLVVFGVISYSLYSARESNADLAESLAAANADLSDLNILLDSQKEKTARLEQIQSIIEKPEVRIAPLVEQSADRASLGAILCEPGQNRCLLLGSLPRAPSGKVYQLWFVKGAAQVPAGTIHADPMGRIFMEVSVPETAADAASALITVEPESGSQIPTRPYYATGHFN